MNIHTLIKFYNLRAKIGTQATAALGVTFILDEFLMNCYKTTKHWLSTSAFWGTLCYKAISQISKSDLSPQTKLVASTLPIATALGLILKGQDIFAKQGTDLTTLLEASKTLAELSDTTGVIKGLKTSYELSLPKALWHGVTHPKILLNPFILSTFGTQLLEISKIYLDRKFFQAMPTDTTSMFLSLTNSKEAGTNVQNLVFLYAGKQILDMVYYVLRNKIATSLSDTLNSDIHKLVLSSPATNVLRIDGVDQLSGRLSNIQSSLTSGLHEITKGCQELIAILSSNHNNTHTVIEQHAILVLMNNALQVFILH